MDTLVRRGLVFEYLEPAKLLISFQDDSASQDDWNRYIDFVATLDKSESVRVLVYDRGAPPSAADQRRIANIARGSDWPVALVSSSTALRFVVSAFRLVNRRISFFTPEQLPQALQHIQCTAAEKVQVQACLRRLQKLP